MKPKPAIDYKRLYQATQQQLSDKDTLIDLLQQQQMQVAAERQIHLGVIDDQRRQLGQREEQLYALQLSNAWQARTIVQQDEKMGEQRKVITEQDRLIKDQQQQLDRQQKDSQRLTRLQYAACSSHCPMQTGH